jgi:hypothetical protein
MFIVCVHHLRSLEWSLLHFTRCLESLLHFTYCCIFDRCLEFTVLDHTRQSSRIVALLHCYGRRPYPPSEYETNASDCKSEAGCRPPRLVFDCCIVTVCDHIRQAFKIGALWFGVITLISEIKDFCSSRGSWCTVAVFDHNFSSFCCLLVGDYSLECLICSLSVLVVFEHFDYA